MDYEKKLTYEDLSEEEIQEYREKRPAFLVYMNQAGLIKYMTDEERSDVLLTLFDFHQNYVGTGRRPEGEHSPLVSGFLEMTLDSGEKDFEEYVNKSLENSRAGKISARRRRMAKSQQSEQALTDADERQRVSTDIDNDKDNENDTNTDIDSLLGNMTNHSKPSMRELQDYLAAIGHSDRTTEIRERLNSDEIDTSNGGWKKAVRDYIIWH